MSNVYKYFVFFVILIVSKVTGMDFTVSKEKVLLGGTGTLTLNCYISEVDVDTLYLIQISRLKSTLLSGSDPNNWQTLAMMEQGKSENPKLNDNIAPNTKDYVVGGAWDSTTPFNTYLTLSMNMEKLVCDDARAYRCELTYKTSINGDVLTPHKNETFTAYVKPQVTSLIAWKNDVIVQGMSPSDMTSAEVGDELELTCTANIGSLPNTVIRWNRTSETDTSDEFIGYQPPQGTFTEGTATSDNQCGYTRVATIKYNATAADANRDNNLAFVCYVTVSGDPYGKSYTSENNPKFYTKVIYPNERESGCITGEEENRTCVSAGVIAAIAIASAIVGMLAGMVITWVILNRKQMIKGPGERNQPQSATVSRETELNVSSILPNNYEQLQSREHADSGMTYDSLDTRSSVVPNR